MQSRLPAKQRFVKGNGASGLPYCWAIPDGNREYMLKMDLHDEGVVVHELAARTRPDTAVWQSLEPVVRMQLMPVEDFISQVRPLKISETTAGAAMRSRR